jgi:hypothetical protein
MPLRVLYPLSLSSSTIVDFARVSSPPSELQALSPSSASSEAAEISFPDQINPTTNSASSFSRKRTRSPSSEYSLSVLDSHDFPSSSKQARFGQPPTSAELASQQIHGDFFSLMPLRDSEEFKNFLTSQTKTEATERQKIQRNNKGRKRQLEDQQDNAESEDVSSPAPSSSSCPSYFTRKRSSSISSLFPSAKRVQPRHRITNLHLRALYEERIRRKSQNNQEVSVLSTKSSKPVKSHSLFGRTKSINLLSPMRKSPHLQFSHVRLEQFDETKSSWAAPIEETNNENVQDTLMGFSLNTADASPPSDYTHQPNSPTADSHHSFVNSSTLPPFSLSLRSAPRTSSTGSAMFD